MSGQLRQRSMLLALSPAWRPRGSDSQWDIWLGRRGGVLEPSEGRGQRARLGAAPDGTGMGTESRIVQGAVFEALASGYTWVRAGENQGPGRPSSPTAGVRSLGRVEGHGARGS